MPNTFFIKDILSNNHEIDYKRPLSPQQKDIFDKTNNNMISSLISIANQQPQQYLSSLSLENITDLYLKSPQSSSSSSSLSSTSPISSTTSSTSNHQITHEQLVNQFYQRLLFLNLQNSLNRIQNGGNSLLQQGFSIKQQNPPLTNNKENNEINGDFNENNSEYDQQSEIDERKYGSKFQPFKKSKKSFSTSSLKISSSDFGEFDESNSDNHSNDNCSTPIDNSNNNVSPLDALSQMATYFNANSNNNNNNNNMMTGNQNFSLIDKCIKLNTPTAITSTPTSTKNIDIIVNSQQIQKHHQSLSSSSSSSNSNNSIIKLSEPANDSLSKRKRKNRTAFTAHQIYELEKRFSHQKYLSPSDRDRISIELSLSTAQVITWFQNRRAKQKRDVEEMKNDLLASKSLCAQSSNEDQFSDCSFSNHQFQNNQQKLHSNQQNKIYSSNNSMENDRNNSDSDISLDSSLS